MTLSLEEQVKRAWQSWGSAWAMYTVCKSCGHYDYCRGRRKNKLLCLQCFDAGKR